MRRFLQADERFRTVPLSIKSSSGLDSKVVLDKRENTFKIDTNGPWKLNAGTTGVYRVLYTPERLTAIANVAARSEDVFSLEDRIGLVYDASALSSAGFAKVSSALSLYKTFKNENECEYHPPMACWDLQMIPG
jgi:aminopeptidase 2